MQKRAHRTFLFHLCSMQSKKKISSATFVFSSLVSVFTSTKTSPMRAQTPRRIVLSIAIQIHVAELVQLVEFKVPRIRITILWCMIRNEAPTARIFQLINDTHAKIASFHLVETKRSARNRVLAILSLLLNRQKKSKSKRSIWCK